MPNPLRYVRPGFDLVATLGPVLVSSAWQAVQDRILPPPAVLDSWAD